MRRWWDKSQPPTGPWCLNRDSIQAQGLVAWWPLGPCGLDTTTAILDLVGSAHSTAVGSSPVLTWRSGMPGVSFTAASTQYYTCGLPTTVIDNWLLSAWAYPTDTATGVTRVACGLGNASTNGYYIRWRDGAWFAALGGVEVGASVSGSASIWSHVGIWRQSGTRHLYLNSVATTIGTATPNAPTTAATIGASVGGAGPWNGVVRDVRVYVIARDHGLVTAMHDPATRYELWYPLRSRKWFVAVGGSFPPYTMQAQMQPFLVR